MQISLIDLMMKIPVLHLSPLLTQKSKIALKIRIITARISLIKLFRHEYGGILIYDNEAIMPNQPVPSFTFKTGEFKGLFLYYLFFICVYNYFKTKIFEFKII